MSFKRLTTLLLMAFCFLTGTFAQRFIVTGTVESGKTNRGVEFVTAALLKSDSTGVTSAMTNEKGTFRLRAKSAGSYIVKISYVGFKTEYRNVVLTRQTDSINIGRIPLENSDNLLKEAVVSVTAARVEQQGDTTVSMPRPTAFPKAQRSKLWLNNCRALKSTTTAPSRGTARR